MWLGITTAPWKAVFQVGTVLVLLLYPPYSGFMPGKLGPTPHCPQMGRLVCVKKSEPGANRV